MRLCELFLDNKAQSVVIDPVGVWYGLRIASDGKGMGYNIPVFGGLHGDLPLEPGSGKLVAELIVERNLSVVLDVSQFETDAETTRFSTDFVDRLFQLRKTHPSPTHIFIEECQEFISQNPMKGEERKLHVFNRLVKLGRNFGIGASLISQRPQEVNKKGLDEDIAQVLPHLEIGCPHVWSPQWLKVSKTIRISKKVTFNASSTPKFGDQPTAPKELSPLDLEEIRMGMQGVVQKATDNDPTVLKRRIAELSRVQPVKVEVQRVEVPVLTQEHITQLRAIAGQLSQAAQALIAFQQGLFARLDRKATPSQITTVRVSEPSVNGRMASGERKILTALAQYPSGRTRSQVAILSGYALGGAYNNYVSHLRTQGYLEGSSGNMRITTNGLEALGDYTPLPTGKELERYWMSKLCKAERSILTPLVKNYPAGVSSVELAALSGYSVGGAYNNALSRLKTLELVRKENGLFKASEDLVEA